MKAGPSYILSFFLTLFLLFTVFSCSDTDINLLNAKGYVLFDYKDSVSKPEVRLAAFVEVSSEVRRVEAVRVKHISSQMEWNCLSPLIFSDSKRQWAGYSDFVSPEGMLIPEGIYDFSYMDAQKNEENLSFNISYNEYLAEGNLDTLKKYSLDNKKETIVIYSETDSIIYHGPKKQNWSDEKKIFLSNKGSKYFRYVYSEVTENAMYLMPPVYRENIENNN